MYMFSEAHAAVHSRPFIPVRVITIGSQKQIVRCGVEAPMNLIKNVAGELSGGDRLMSKLDLMLANQQRLEEEVAGLRETYDQGGGPSVGGSGGSRSQSRVPFRRGTTAGGVGRNRGESPGRSLTRVPSRLLGGAGASGLRVAGGSKEDEELAPILVRGCYVL